jgi:hypothetical protein
MSHFVLRRRIWIRSLVSLSVNSERFLIEQNLQSREQLSGHLKVAG